MTPPQLHTLTPRERYRLLDAVRRYGVPGRGRPDTYWRHMASARDSIDDAAQHQLDRFECIALAHWLLGEARHLRLSGHLRSLP